MFSVRFVYFDLDDTLLDHRKAERRALGDLCRAFPDVFDGIDPVTVQETYHRHNVPLWQRYGAGEIDKATLKRRRFAALLEALSLDGPPPETLSDHYMDRYARHWTFIAGARAAFAAIADRYPVGILTNGFAEVQHAKLNRFPLLRDRARALVISEEVGYLKPDPRLFAHAAACADTPPETILYVGDSFHSDVRGGHAAGWQVAWYTRMDTPADDVFRFHEWPALCAYLNAG